MQVELSTYQEKTLAAILEKQGGVFYIPGLKLHKHLTVVYLDFLVRNKTYRELKCTKCQRLIKLGDYINHNYPEAGECYCAKCYEK